ncbi:small RNA degrading nuclease 1 [Cocos nucifera]|nr:small RNA degrading nuclease 1 [Cocos nucifera]
MDKAISNADREVLAEIVRLTQKRGLKSREGGWKDFLHSNYGESCAVYDPTRKSKDVLLAFLQTFQEKDQKCFQKMIKRVAEYKAFEKFITDFPDQESPQQVLAEIVRLTQKRGLKSREGGWKDFLHSNYGESCAVYDPTRKSKDVLLAFLQTFQEKDQKCFQKMIKRVAEYKAFEKFITDFPDQESPQQVKLDKLVNPGKAVADYRTDITGISAKDLEGVTCSLADVQSVLGFALRTEGEPHDCLNDAKAAMKLVLAKLEHGFDDPISVVDNNVLDVPYQDLLKLFPENYNVDIKNDLKVRGFSYSTFAVFKDAREADEAFKGIEAIESRVNLFAMGKTNGWIECWVVDFVT